MKKSLPLLLATFAFIGTTWSQTNADNTGKNARDANGEHVTSGDQSNSPEDLKLAAAIRKLVVADDALSITAKNAKIISIQEVVTLRGPVNSQAEKAAIEAHAKEAGAKKIVNELEIKNS